MKNKLWTTATIMMAIVAAGAQAEDRHASHPQTIELYAMATDISMQLSTPPQPGEFAAFGRDLYRLGGSSQAPAPVGPPIGRNLVFCTMVTTTEALCNGSWFLDDRGPITGSAYLDFSVPPGTGPGAFGSALTGGSGAFTGATGAISNRPVPGTQDQVWIIRFSRGTGR